MKATFIYLNSRRALIEGVRRGDEPDTQLYGALFLPEHGIDVAFHEPLLSRRRLPAPLERVAWNARELAAPFEVGRTDVLVTPLAAWLPLAARARRLPAVVFNFGLNLIWRRASRERRALLRRSLLAAARVICLGESQRSELVALAGLPAEHVVTMLVPVDDRFFTPAPASGRRTVLAVGKDLARDYATLAGAVDGLDAEVRVVAHPRNLAGIALPANVRVEQGLSYADLRAAYADAGCVVLPQRGEGFAYGSEGGGLTALLEAMATARPVVASERAILRDYVEDGREALVVPPEDPSALREAIERVLSDGGLAQRLGEAGRARVERAHTSRGFAAQLAPMLRAVV